MKTLVLKFEDDTAAALKSLAALNGVPVSEFVQRMVRGQLLRHAEAQAVLDSERAAPKLPKPPGVRQMCRELRAMYEESRP